MDPSDASSGTQTSRANVAIVAAAVLDLPGCAGRTIEFRDGTRRFRPRLNAVK